MFIGIGLAVGMAVGSSVGMVGLAAEVGSGDEIAAGSSGAAVGDDAGLVIVDACVP